MADGTSTRVLDVNLMPTEITTTHRTDGLPGWGAYDWFRPAGSIVGLPTGGTVEQVRPSRGSGKVYGTHVYVRLDNGRRLFLTHFDRVFVRGGDRLDPGEPIGTVADYGRADHIHIAAEGAADKGAKVSLGGGGGGVTGAIGDAITSIPPFRNPAAEAGAKVGAGAREGIASAADAFRWITDPSNLARVAQVGGGFVLVIVGVVMLARQTGLPVPGGGR